MARAAVFSLTAFMGIVVFVTINASLSGQVCRHGPQMAAFASDLGMGAAQPETSVFVMTECCLLPGCINVTISALHSVASLMRIVFFVTGNTILIEFWLKQRVRVTRRAFDFRVAAA